MIKKEYSRIFFHNQADNILVIELRSIIKLNMVINLVSFGVSFQQASRLYQSVKEETGMGVMRSISDVVELYFAVSEGDIQEYLG